MNKTSRNNFYSLHQSIYSNNFKNTLSNLFLKKKPKLNIKLVSNYHNYYLRERIKSNSQFQHLFLKENKIPYPFSTLYSKKYSS